MRTEKELWELVLSRPDLFDTGLCHWIMNTWGVAFGIKEREASHLYGVVEVHLTAGKPGYVWPKGDIVPRIEWIKNRIKQLENGEL